MTERLRIVGGLLLIWWALSQGGGGDRVVVPDIDTEGLYVLVMLDQSKDGMTPEQASVANGTRLVQEVRGQGGEYRRFDARDDLSPVDPVWRAMAEKMTSPPQMGVLRNRRLAVHPMPSSHDEAVRLLGR